MQTIESVYYSYQQAKARSTGKGFRTRVNFSKAFNKLSKPNQDALYVLTENLNTKWRNIDLDLYLDCGFKLFKTFGYHLLLRPEVMAHYKDVKAREEKRLNRILNRMEKSFVFVYAFVKKENLNFDRTVLTNYNEIMVDGVVAPIRHYEKGLIDDHFMVFLIQENPYLSVNNRSRLSNLFKRYRDFVYDLNRLASRTERLKQIRIKNG